MTAFPVPSASRLPLPVVAVALLLIALGLFAGYAGYGDLSAIVPGFDQDAPANAMAAQMIGARSLSGAAVLLLGLAWRSAPILLAGFAMRFLTEAQDFVVTLARPDVPMGAGLVVFFLVILAAELFCVATLYRRRSH